MRYELGSDKVIGKALDDEAVIINLETGMYYGLDGPSARVWALVSAGASTDAVKAGLEARYSDIQGLGAQFDQLLSALVDAGLIKPAADTSTPGPEVSHLSFPDKFQPLEMTSYDDVAEMVALDPPLPELSHQSIAAE